MGLWTRLLRWRGVSPADESAVEDVEPEPIPVDEVDNTVVLPTEPFVFECQSCGKVFEARRKRPQCPECDSSDVSVMSE